MDTIQALRLKAEKAGTLQSSEQQKVVVTNTLVQQVVNQQTVVVTNQIVEIGCAHSRRSSMCRRTIRWQFIIRRNAALRLQPGRTAGDILAWAWPWARRLRTIAIGTEAAVYVGHHGVAVWGGGGNGYHNDVDVNRKVNIENNGDININNNNNNRQNVNGQNVQNRQNAQNGQNGGQKWQPDQSRLQKSGSAAATSYQSREARGYGGNTANNTACQYWCE